MDVRAWAGTGHVAAGRISSSTRNHTVASVAPVPSAKSRAMRGRMSSPPYVSLTCSENPDSTSYGVARLP